MPSITSYIIAALFTIVLSTFVIYRKNRYKAKNNEKIGWLKSSYLFLVIAIVSFLFIPISSKLIQPGISYFKLPRYEAIVVDIKSESEDIHYSDLEGTHYLKKIIMHTAILEFIDNQGNTIRKLNNISTAHKPEIAQKFTVIYKDDKIQEFSFRAIIKKLNIGLILSIIGYCFLLATVLIEVMILY